eukprot:5797949-Lingulodinium_polyedra.AAC.1
MGAPGGRPVPGVGGPPPPEGGRLGGGRRGHHPCRRVTGCGGRGGASPPGRVPGRARLSAGPAPG